MEVRRETRLLTESPLTHSTFSLDRDYAVPPEKVVRALSDPDMKARWLADPTASGDKSLPTRTFARADTNTATASSPRKRLRALTPPTTRSWTDDGLSTTTRRASTVIEPLPQSALTSSSPIRVSTSTSRTATTNAKTVRASCWSRSPVSLKTEPRDRRSS